MRTLVTLFAFALLAGCAEAPRYSYRPTPSADADATGGGVPHGAVRVSVVGVPRHALVHVRMVVNNADGEVWTVDAADQRALVDGRANVAPRFTRCDGDELATAVLMPGETRTLDLWYPLPPKVGAAPPVRVDWRVRTPSGVVTRRTTAFAAEVLPPPPKIAPERLDPRTLAREVPRRDRGDIDGGGR